MFYTDSQDFFDITIGPQQDRFHCVKDFLKRCLRLPVALIGKLCKTSLRLLAIILSVVLLCLTLGFSQKAKEIFVSRIVRFAKDLADWVLFPLTLLVCFLRLILALLIHPNFYTHSA